MPPRLRVFYSGLIAALLLIPVLAVYRELSQRSDIWWTPAPMALSLAESQDRVEIYARGKPLGTLLDHKQVWVNDQMGSGALGGQEIRLRFNNWDRVRAGRIPLLLAYGAACGAGAVLFLLVATDRLAYRGEKPTVAA
jgi:hypothetical protein